MKTLYLIPARGGSKGIPKKNIKLLAGKPLICYSIDSARQLANDDDICVSTDCDEIRKVVQDYGLKVPFVRPEELSNDNSGTYGVLLHALDYFENQGVFYDRVVVLQPTSPFRTKEHLDEILLMYSDDLDMVVSVGESHLSPYFTLFEENEMGLLEKSKGGYFEARQQAPPIYYYNGSIYLINCKSLKKSPLHKFKKVKKYFMNDFYSVDIDTPLDWLVCEIILKEGYVCIDK
jgi:CMP-N,N'-diacetyllegionaminic acid synthase